MTKINITTDTNFKKLLKKGRNLNDVKTVVKWAGAEQQRGAMRKVPVDTGALKGSITMELENSGFTSKVYPTKEYAIYVEYGTRFMDAQPFMRPVFEKVSNEFKKKLERLMK